MLPYLLLASKENGVLQEFFVEGGNALSQLVPQVEQVSAAGALSTAVAESVISNGTGGDFAVTLAAPSNQDGQFKIIKAGATMSHNITLSLANVAMSGAYTPTGTTTLTFSGAGQSAVFVAVGAKWVYLGGSAVAS